MQVCGPVRVWGLAPQVAAPALLVHGVEGSSDDQPADLTGAGADFVQLGVSEEAAHWVVVDVAIPAWPEEE